MYHKKVPKVACNVKSDLSGVAKDHNFKIIRGEGQLNEPVWRVDNNIQRYR